MKSALASLLTAAVMASHATALTAADAAGSWMLLTPAGSVTGRDGRGPYLVGDTATMSRIIANTQAHRGSTELLVDYDHQNIFGAVPGVGGTAKAAGWVKELQVRADGIWGRIEWTEAAASAIKAGEYRYLSPVFFAERKDGGRVLALQSVTITNTPNFDLVAVAASSLLQLPTTENGESMDKILAALGLPAGTTEDNVVVAITAMKSSGIALAKAAGLADTAKTDDVLAAVTAAFADRNTIAVAVNLKPEAATSEIVTAVQTAMKGGTPDPTKFVPIEMVTTLQADVKTLQDNMSANSAETAVGDAIKAGKIAPAQKDWALAYHKANPAQFKTFVDNAPELTKSQLGGKKKEGAGDGELDAAQLAACTALGLDPKKFAETAAAEAKKEVL